VSEINNIDNVNHPPHYKSSQAVCDKCGDRIECSEWISVRNKTPNPMQLVLIYAPKEDYLKIRIAIFDDWTNIEYSLGITHWMPLPSPPENKE
jgi:hypothetical protein